MFRFDDRSTEEAMAKRSLWNQKPYRTKELKREARRRAHKGKDGAFHCDVHVLHHPKPRNQ